MMENSFSLCESSFWFAFDSDWRCNVNWNRFKFLNFCFSCASFCIFWFFTLIFLFCSHCLNKRFLFILSEIFSMDWQAFIVFLTTIILLLPEGIFSYYAYITWTTLIKTDESCWLFHGIIFYWLSYSFAFQSRRLITTRKHSCLTWTLATQKCVIKNSKALLDSL